MSHPLPSQTRSGVINAIAAYSMWGVAPLYFKLLITVSASEILVHRIVWSTLFLLLVVIVSQKTSILLNLLKRPKMILALFISATFLAANWFLFIWAVNNDHILDASLGYFINPLFSVALGMIFLQERLRKWQKFAVVLAFIGVVIQLVILGTLPIISLGLAGTFGIYGLLRKKMHIDSFVGLLVESAIMLPIALVYWFVFIDSETANMMHNSLELNSTLVLAGIVTTAPLICFTAATKRLTLMAVGFLQYIGPSIMFILATLYFQESLAPSKLVTFAFIWLALAIFTFDSLWALKQKRRDNIQP